MAFDASSWDYKSQDSYKEERYIISTLLKSPQIEDPSHRQLGLQDVLGWYGDAAHSGLLHLKNFTPMGRSLRAPYQNRALETVRHMRSGPIERSRKATQVLRYLHLPLDAALA